MKDIAVYPTCTQCGHSGEAHWRNVVDEGIACFEADCQCQDWRPDRPAVEDPATT